MKQALLLIGAFVLARPAAAAEVRGNFSTLLSASEEPRAGEVVSSVPLYELASAYVDNLSAPGVDELRLAASGWGRLQLGDDQLHDTSGDLQLFYLEARKGPLQLRLGRQHITQGAGRMTLIDGLNAELHAGLGISAQGFFGATTHREFKWDRGDWQGGGRLAKRLGVPGEVGISYKQARLNGIVARDELAADGFCAWVVRACSGSPR